MINVKIAFPFYIHFYIDNVFEPNVSDVAGTGQGSLCLTTSSLDAQSSLPSMLALKTFQH